MLTFVTIVHVLLCVFMIFVILLQPGKDAGMGAALGGGAATSAFGGRGAVTFLTKITGICAALFFLTSLGLSFVGMRTSVRRARWPTSRRRRSRLRRRSRARPSRALGLLRRARFPRRNPQEAAPPSGSAPAAPGSVEQPRAAETPAPAPGQ